MQLEKEHIIYVVVSVIVFVLLILIWHSRSIECNYMQGFYKADADFCETADLEMFMLYLGDNKGWFHQHRTGYIVAKNSHGFILNNPISISFQGCYAMKPSIVHCKKYNVTIKWTDEEEHDEDVFPSEFKAAYYPRYHKLVFYHEGDILAVLYKDLQLDCLETDGLLYPEETIMDDEELESESI